jgi:hypothetical protein
MAISRPFLLALLGVALLGATVFAVQNARTQADPAPAQQASSEQAGNAPAPAPAQTAGPEELIASAFSADVESASFDAKLTFTSLGERNLVSASGAFEDNGPKAMPEVEVDVRAVVGSMNLNQRGGFVTTGDRAWFTRGSTGYAIPQSIWSELVKARESGAKPAATETPELDVDTSGWLRDAKSEGKERVGGAETTHFSAEVDSAKAITDIVRAVGEAGQGAALGGNAEQQLRKAGIKNGNLDVWVGDDKILRRVTLTLEGKGDGGRQVTGTLDFRLSGVNEPQDIARPAKVTRRSPGGPFGAFTDGALTAIASGAGLDAQELRIGVPVTNSHLKAERAVADNRKVVIFFHNPRALDDQAVADSVRSLDRRTKSVVVLKDVVQNVDLYGSLLEDLGVSQAPAIVVIDRNGQASLIEGYTDAESLAQVVADAR